VGFGYTLIQAAFGRLGEVFWLGRWLLWGGWSWGMKWVGGMVVDDFGSGVAGTMG